MRFGTFISLVFCFGLTVLFVFCCSRAYGQARWRGVNYSGRVCTSGNCTMCNSIEMQLRSQVIQSAPPAIRQNVILPARKPEAAPLPPAERLAAFELLGLGPDHVFADIGCGDGRVIIEASKRYGCRAVGIEIDKGRAQQAWNNVRAAERAGDLEPGRVKVFHGDAADFDAKRYGVTHAIAYLFPGTLEAIAGTLRQVPHVAVPFHEVPGEKYAAKRDSVYLYKFGEPITWFGGRRFEPIRIAGN